MTIPLVYKPQISTEEVIAPMQCPSLAAVTVVDKRADRLLGTRIHESKPLRADVSLGSDPAPWVRQGTTQFLSQKGVNFSPGAPTLVLELGALRTSENIWHRSGYEAKILLGAELRSPTGKTCWHESLDGKSGNYGYSGSIVDYQETLNSALDAATLHLLNSASFNAALCHCGE
jgi:hypothetical protein